MMNLVYLRTVAAALAAYPVLATQEATVSVRVPRHGDVRTRAGIYDGRGRLLQQASCHEVAAELRVWSIEASYEWLGVIGNTGPQTGQAVLRGLEPVWDMAAADGIAVLALSYEEQGNSFGMMYLNDTSTFIPLGHPDYHRQFPLAATDGRIAYFANTGIAAPNTSYYHLPVTYIIGIDLTTRCEHNFTVGGIEECEEGNGQGPCVKQWDGCNGGGQYWSSVLDYARVDEIMNGTLPDAATGLAVQRDPGTLLAVSHAFRSRLHVFDKTTGESLCNYTVANPQSIAFDPQSGALWMVNGVVQKYMLDTGCGPLPAPQVTVDNSVVQLPGAISVAPYSGRVFVADLASQQIKVLNGTTGALLQVLGEAGGYTDGADVSVRPSKFWFLPTLLGGGSTNDSFIGRGSCVAFDDNEEETMWIGDAGNRRVLHLDSAGNYLGNFGWLPRSYRSAVHPTNVSRVFSNFMEFSYDPTLPVNESWSLVRNWGAGTPAAFTPFDDGSGLQRWPFAGFAAIGYAFNRTVGLVGAFPNAPFSTDGEFIQMVELVGSPTPHLSFLQNFTKGSVTLHGDGSLRYSLTIVDPPNAWQEIWIAPISINASGSPWWGLPGNLLASFNVSTNTSQSFMARGGGVSMMYPTTSNGNVVLLDATPAKNGGNHLGAMPVGGSQLAWTASPWGRWIVTENTTEMQPGNVNVTVRVIENMDGTYGANASSINYAASYPMAVGDNIVYGFYGEGWNQGEANQFLHFQDDGLFVGQFGVPNFPDASPQWALPGMAGNSFSPTLLPDPTSDGDGTRMLMFHNDESAHGGVHVWRISVSARVRVCVTDAAHPRCPA